MKMQLKIHVEVDILLQLLHQATFPIQEDNRLRGFAHDNEKHFEAYTIKFVLSKVLPVAGYQYEQLHKSLQMKFVQSFAKL